MRLSWCTSLFLASLSNFLESVQLSEKLTVTQEGSLVNYISHLWHMRVNIHCSLTSKCLTVILVHSANCSSFTTITINKLLHFQGSIMLHTYIFLTFCSVQSNHRCVWHYRLYCHTGEPGSIPIPLNIVFSFCVVLSPAWLWLGIDNRWFYLDINKNVVS